MRPPLRRASNSSEQLTVLHRLKLRNPALLFSVRERNAPGQQVASGDELAIHHALDVPDVREITNYLACSTETRSELVVLIRNGDTIYGQIDIDSHRVSAFDESAVGGVQRVADWLAKAYAAKASPRRTPA